MHENLKTENFGYCIPGIRYSSGYSTVDWSTMYMMKGVYCTVKPGKFLTTLSLNTRHPAAPVLWVEWEGLRLLLVEFWLTSSSFTRWSSREHPEITTNSRWFSTTSTCAEEWEIVKKFDRLEIEFCKIRLIVGIVEDQTITQITHTMYHKHHRCQKVTMYCSLILYVQYLHTV